MIRLFIFIISLVLIILLPETTATFSILKFFLVLGMTIPLLSGILQFYSIISVSNVDVISLLDRFTKWHAYAITDCPAEIMELSRNIFFKINKKAGLKIQQWKYLLEKLPIAEMITPLKSNVAIVFNERGKAGSGQTLLFDAVKKSMKSFDKKKILSVGISGFLVMILLFQWLTPVTVLPPLEKITLDNRSYFIPKGWTLINQDKNTNQIIFGNQDKSERIGIINSIFMSTDTHFTDAVDSEIESLKLRNKKIISQYRADHSAASLLEYDHINGERYTTLLDFTRLGQYKYKIMRIDMPKDRFYDSQAIRLLPIVALGMAAERVNEKGKYYLDIVKPKKPYQYDMLPLLSGMNRYKENGLLTVKAPIGWQLQAEILSSMFVYRKEDTMLIDDAYYPDNLSKKIFYKDKTTGKQHKYPFAKAEYEKAILRVVEKLGLDNISTVSKAQNKSGYLHFKEIRGDMNGKKMRVSVVLISNKWLGGIILNMFVAPEKQYYQLGGKYLLMTTLLGYEPSFHQRNHLPHPNDLNADQFLTQYINFVRSKYPKNAQKKPSKKTFTDVIMDGFRMTRDVYPAVQAGQSAIGNP